jgi:hypothetical protein
MILLQQVGQVGARRILLERELQQRIHLALPLRFPQDAVPEVQRAVGTLDLCGIEADIIDDPQCAGLIVVQVGQRLPHSAQKLAPVGHGSHSPRKQAFVWHRKVCNFTYSSIAQSTPRVKMRLFANAWDANYPHPILDSPGNVKYIESNRKHS